MTRTPGDAAELVRRASESYRPIDPDYAEPYLDIDEWRDTPEPHRYVHGGFTGTDLKFSYYFPPAAKYAGRFLQVLPPISGFDQGAGTDLCYGSPGSIGFAFDTGGYLVESNMGTLTPMPPPDGSIPGYRASAAAARFSRCVAAAIFGEHRPYGYVFGGSGGAFKTIACVENAPDVWDGAVPFVQGSPIAIPNCFAAQAHAMRVLADVVPQIVDALEPGGSGDMYAGLTTEQREALAEVTRFGFPPGAWFDVVRVRAGYTMMWAAFAGPIAQVDPTYFSDFWSVPGYLGHDAPESLRAARVKTTTTVAALVDAGEAQALGLPLPMALTMGGATDVPVALRVQGNPGGDPFGAKLTVVSGAAAGREFYLSAVAGDVVAVQMFGGDGLVGIAVGDQVHIDNSDYLAFQTLPRHQVQEGFDCFDQYVAAGAPIYPQRPRSVGQRVTRGTWGHAQSGRFGVKMIAVASMLDEAAYPWQAAWYRRRVQSVLGDRIGDQYRLWFVEHAMHGPAQPAMVQSSAERPAAATRTISYVGILEQAIRDVIAWVEHGVTPPADTAHHVQDGQVVLHGDGTTRGGIQPTVRLTVGDGHDVVRVRVGDQVRFAAEVRVPPGTGTVVRAEWDFDGDGDFPHEDDAIDGTLTSLVVCASHAFTEAGTFFPALRVTTHRRSDAATPYARVQCLGRVRVIVE